MNFQNKKEVSQFLAAILFIGLLFACIGKSLRIDTYGSFMKKIIRVYQHNAVRQAYVYVPHEEKNRISWYLKPQAADVQVFHLGDNKTVPESLKVKIPSLKNILGDHYFFFYLKKGEAEPSAEMLGITPQSGSWEVLARYYTSRKKKKEILLARYRSNCPNIREWNEKISESQPQNIYAFGDFEKVLQGNKLKSLENYYKKNQIQGYQNLSNRKLPQGWWFTLNSWNKDNPPDIRLQDTSPLAGQYSLQIDARQPKGRAIFNNAVYLNTSCNYTVFVRGEGGKPSKIRLAAVSRNEKTKENKSMELGTFLIPPGKIYRLHGKIPCDRFARGFQNFCLQFFVDGYITLDQLSLTPLKR